MQRALRSSQFLAGRFAPAVFVLALVASGARADDATQWLARASQAARQLDYVGTIVYQIGPRVESSKSSSPHARFVNAYCSMWASP